MTVGRPRSEARDIALMLGDKFYEGTQCLECGTTTRYTIGSRCVKCARAQAMCGYIPHPVPRREVAERPLPYDDGAHHYLYKITSPEHKSYVGRSKNPHKRFYGHLNSERYGNKTLIGIAIGKFSLTVNDVQTLACGSFEYISYLEEKAIEAFNTLEPNGYNQNAGGLGGCGAHSPAVCAILSVKGTLAWRRGTRHDRYVFKQELGTPYRLRPKERGSVRHQRRNAASLML